MEGMKRWSRRWASIRGTAVRATALALAVAFALTFIVTFAGSSGAQGRIGSRVVHDSRGVPFGTCSRCSNAASASALAAGKWVRLRDGPLSPRGGASEVWTGSRFFVWGGGQTGGFCSDGALFDPATGHWRRLPASPLSPRSLATALWTGSDVVVWGGYVGHRPHLDLFSNAGAFYDPSTNRWRLLPQAPLSPRARAFLAWTGHTVIVFGGVNTTMHTTESFPLPDGATYSPATGQWRRLPAFPMPAGTGIVVTQIAAVWTGHELLALANYGKVKRTDFAPAPNWVGALRAHSLLAAWRPGWGSWRVVGQAPRRLRWTLTASNVPLWTGTRLVLVQGTFPGSLGGVTVPTNAYSFVLDRRRWLRMPPNEVQALAADSAWTGEAIVGVGGGGRSVAYVPARSKWIRLPRAPLSLTAPPVWTGKELLQYGTGGVGSSTAGFQALIPRSA
jgi:N-acetylneuraminic acid mutarotase